jgi:gamma-glutamylputrescine oxidase
MSIIVILELGNKFTKKFHSQSTFFMQLYEKSAFSYWELNQYFKSYDLIIIGSGIVGLSTAISFKQLNAKARVLILEKGIMPDGASTKNAGFACFGSPGELLDDLNNMPEKNVWETVQMRWQGLQLLRTRLKDKNIGFLSYGGFELFDDKKNYADCLEKINYLNNQVKKVLKLKNCYSEVPCSRFPFNSIKGILSNAYEGQINTGMMMKNLAALARKNDVDILCNVQVLTLQESANSVEIQTTIGIFKAEKVVVATNGFATNLLKIKNVLPARAQVLVTKPIKGLRLKGTFQFHKGYYYFRNIDNRILFGGGRNLDFKGERTMVQALNPRIQNQLDRLLKEIILPGTAFEIEHRWSGIMGVGNEKKPIIQKVGRNILAAVRMGGMGIAIGSLVGEKAAKQIS